MKDIKSVSVSYDSDDDKDIKERMESKVIVDDKSSMETMMKVVNEKDPKALELIELIRKATKIEKDLRFKFQTYKRTDFNKLACELWDLRYNIPAYARKLQYIDSQSYHLFMIPSYRRKRGQFNKLVRQILSVSNQFEEIPESVILIGDAMVRDLVEIFNDYAIDICSRSIFSWLAAMFSYNKKFGKWNPFNDQRNYKCKILDKEQHAKKFINAKAKSKSPKMKALNYIKSSKTGAPKP